MSVIKVDQLEALDEGERKEVKDLLVIGDKFELEESIAGVSQRVDENQEAIEDLQRVTRSVLEFGAIGDGVADDTLAIQEGVNSFDTQGGELLFPPGVYRTTASVNIFSKPVSLKGTGSSSSIILGENDSPFRIDTSALPDKERVNIIDLGFETVSNGTLNAVVFQGKPGSSLGAQLTVKYCSFTGRANAQSWRQGIVLRDAKFTEISGCFFRGNTSDLTVQRACITMDESTDVKIHNNYFYWSSIGIEITGFSEGIDISGSHFAPVDIGVTHQGTGNLVWVRDNHIAANVVAVRLGRDNINSVNHCQVLNNLIFKRPSSMGGFTGIQVRSKRHAIIGNEVLIPGGSAAGGVQNGIVLHSQSAMCRVVGNQISNMDTGILVQSGSTNNAISANTFLACNNDVVNNGSATKVEGASQSALVFRSTDYVLGNEVLTPVAWNAVERNEGGFWSATNASRLTVPAGVSEVQVSAGVRFEAVGSGERFLEIRKNNSVAAVGLPSSRQVAVAGSNMNVISAVLNVVQGDFFEVHLRQTSGANLNLIGDAQSWFHIEAKGL